MYLSADYFTGKGITYAVLFTIEGGLQGAGFGEYIGLITVSSFIFILVIALAYVYFHLIRNISHPKPKKIKGMVHNVFLFLAFVVHPFCLDLYNIYTTIHVTQSNDFEKYYKKPELSNQMRHSYNLVYIYAESLEKTYFDSSIFPALMPELSALRSQGTEFTDINQVHGTGWTIGGMTSSQCGIPLFTPSWGNSMSGTDSFLSGATCLGDILKKLNYHLVFMQGSSVDFSGIRKFYATHKFDEIYGREILSKRLEKPAYYNGWGLFDDTLFPLVYEKFETLSKSNKPFALFMATIDTHHPNGMTSASCNDIPYGDGQNTILNAVHCSDRLIAQFIYKIQHSKYADNTLIVLSSDHLAMKNTATELLEKGNRKDLLLIFDPKNRVHKEINKTGSMFDVGATLLDHMGVNTALGLGRNLYKDNSLSAQFENFNNKLPTWRDEILDLWQFARLGPSYLVDLNNMHVKIGEQSYKIPILLKVNKNRTVIPFFEFYSPKQMIDYLKDFSETQKFIWIDNCRKINQVFDLNMSANGCLVQGSLSGAIDYFPLTVKPIKVDTTHLIRIDTKNDHLLYKKRVNKMHYMISCKYPPKDKIALVSASDTLSGLIPSAIRTHQKILPIGEGLNLLSLDNGGQYRVENFSINSESDGMSQFYKSIMTIIKEKKKFAIVLSNITHQEIADKYRKKAAELGFKILSTLRPGKPYIAYEDSGGKVHEFADQESICKIVKLFQK